jgi:hypothetical protein
LRLELDGGGAIGADRLLDHCVRVCQGLSFLGAPSLGEFRPQQGAEDAAGRLDELLRRGIDWRVWKLLQVDRDLAPRKVVEAYVANPGDLLPDPVRGDLETLAGDIYEEEPRTG